MPCLSASLGVIENPSDLDLNLLPSEASSICCEFLLKQSSIRNGPNDSLFRDHLSAVRRQEHILEPTILELLRGLQHRVEARNRHHLENISTPEIDRVLDASLVLAWCQCWTRPQTSLAELLTHIVRAVRDIEREAECFLLLGKLHFRLDSYIPATSFLRLAKITYLKAGSRMGALRAELEACDAVLWSGQHISSHDRNAIESLEKEVGTLQAHYLYLSQTANIYWFDTFQNRELIQMGRKAIQGFESLSMPLEAADTLYRLARTHGALNRHEEGLTIIQQSIDAFDRLGVAGCGIGVFVYIVKARYVKATDVWGSQLTDTLIIALDYAQKYGAPLAIAQALEEWAEVYLKNGEWDRARLAYAGALKQCERISSTTGSVVANNCQNNLLYIKQIEKGQMQIFGEDFVLPARY